MTGLSFVKVVGYNGIEELVEKGYTNKEIAKIYDISIPTLYAAFRQLYGANWKKALKEKLALKASSFCMTKTTGIHVLIN